MRTSKERKFKLICHRLRTFVLGLALGNWPILGLSDERHKFDRLEDAVYELEVCAYCGLVNDQVLLGYQNIRERLVTEHSLSRADIDMARGLGWQLAYAEWQNRGLGGFRGWCANEGIAAARSLASYAGIPDPSLVE
jgi:hypothetical protein